MEHVLRQWADERVKRLDLGIAGLQADIRLIEDQIAELRVRRSVYVELRETPPSDLPRATSNGAITGPALVHVQLSPPSSMRPAEAVTLLLSEMPGISRQEMMRLLRDQVESTSPQPERVISATISRKLKRGELYQDRDGLLWPADHPVVEALRDQPGLGINEETP